MAKYIPFTDEEKHRANSVDLVDFLQRQGEQLTRAGRDWRWKRYDSVVIRGNRWYRHSREQGGLAIDFVQEFYGLSFPEAVTMLLGGEGGVEWNQTHKSAPPPRKPFALPDVNSDMRRVFAYLMKQRFIHRDIITHFAKAKMIYESREQSKDKTKEYHNAIFVGYDENGIPRHAHKRGLYTMGPSFRGNVESSDPEYSFHHIGTNDTLYVFEAPIDILSNITLYPEGWKQNSYVALDGVAEHAMLRQLALNPHLKKVVLCLDHDEAGIESAGRLTEILREREYEDVSVWQPKYKDWNEDLKAKHGVTPIPAQEHPKLEALPVICAELYDTCKIYVSNRSLNAVLMENYEKLKAMLANTKLSRGLAPDMTEHLLTMAAAALLAAQRQYRQMDEPVTVDQLIGELQDGYRPHQDRGMLRSKADDLQKDITDISRQINIAGLRSPEDQHRLIASYLHLAQDCVKAQIFVYLEDLRQTTEEVCRQNADRSVREQAGCTHMATQTLM